MHQNVYHMIGSLNTCIINASVCPGSKDQALLVQLQAPLPGISETDTLIN